MTMDNAFDQLEDKVRKAADALRRLRQENRSLQDEVSRLRPRISEMEKSLQGLQAKGPSSEDTERAAALSREIEGLRAERDEIRRRIAKLVQVLDALDAQE
jgi:chromosome segregation ATPase